MCGRTDYTATLKVFRVRVLSVAKKKSERKKKESTELKTRERQAEWFK